MDKKNKKKKKKYLLFIIPILILTLIIGYILIKGSNINSENLKPTIKEQRILKLGSDGFNTTYGYNWESFDYGNGKSRFISGVSNILTDEGYKPFNEVFNISREGRFIKLKAYDFNITLDWGIITKAGVFRDSGWILSNYPNVKTKLRPKKVRSFISWDFDINTTSIPTIIKQNVEGFYFELVSAEGNINWDDITKYENTIYIKNTLLSFDKEVEKGVDLTINKSHIIYNNITNLVIDGMFTSDPVITHINYNNLNGIKINYRGYDEGMEVQLGNTIGKGFDDTFTLSKWDKESNMKIYLPEDESELNWDNKYINKSYDNFDAVWYTINDSNFEFEIILNEKPSKNFISFPIDLGELECHLQPAANVKFNNFTHCNETDCWEDPLDKDGTNFYHRPEDLVNSQACYHSSKSGNEYYAGKVLDIKRIKAIDSNNNSVWGFVYIINGEMNISIPQSFLDTAIYPVIIDPAFGWTTIGGGVAAINNNRMNVNWNWQSEGGHEGNITGANVYLVCTDGGNCGGMNKLLVGVYAKRWVLAETFLLNKTAITDATTGTAHWQFIDFSSTMDKSEVYTVGVQANNSVASRLRIYGDTFTNLVRYVDVGNLTAPSTLSGASTSSTVRSVFVNFTEANPCISGVCDFDNSYIDADLRFNDGVRAGTNYGFQIKWDVFQLLDIVDSCDDIDTALMQFYIQTVNGAPDDDARIHYISDSVWNESSTAAYLEAQTEENQTDITFSNTVNTWTNLSVTNLVEEACSRGENNITIRIQDIDAIAGTISAVTDEAGNTFGQVSGLPPDNHVFSDRENSNITRRPRLWVNYSTGAEANDPDITLLFPNDNNLSVLENSTFICNVSDDTAISNVTLYGNWSGIWHDVYTNGSGLNNMNYTFPNLDLSIDFVNQTDSFEIDDSPLARGITNNGSDYWVIDDTNDAVRHYNSSGHNQTDGFNLTTIGAIDPRGITTNNTHILISDVVDDFVYCVNMVGDNQSCGFNPSAYATVVGGITNNISHIFLADSLDDLVHCVNSSLQNDSCAFDISTYSSTVDGIGNNISHFYITDNDEVYLTNNVGTLLKTINITREGVMTSSGLSTGSHLSGGVVNDIYLSDSEDDFVYHLAGGQVGNYTWGCFACDTFGNCDFSSNRTVQLVDKIESSVNLKTHFPANNTYNSTNTHYNINLTCNMDSAISITSVVMSTEKWYGGWNVNNSKVNGKIYNITTATNNGDGNWSAIINITDNGFYTFECNATNALGETNSSDRTFFMTGIGEVFLRHDVHVEPTSVSYSIFSQTLDLSNMDESAVYVDSAFNTANRYKYNDSHGNPMTFVWKLRMDELACESTQGCSATIDGFLNDAWNYTSNSNIDGNYTFWGDELGWHFHFTEWFNWTKWNAGDCGGGDCQPAKYWNQILTMNDTIYRNVTDKLLAEKILSIFVIDSEFYPTSTVIGWLGMTDQISNWLSDYVPFDYDNWVGTQGTDAIEPIDNVWNFTKASPSIYNPSPTDYQEVGNNSNFIMQCGPGGLDDAPGTQWEMINYSFWLASMGTDNILCHWTHSYTANALVGDTADLHECINESIWGSNCPNGNEDMASLYPLVNYTYTSATDMSQRILGKTDISPPEINISKTGNLIYINSSEELWNTPILALKNTSEKYTLCNLTEVSATNWSCDITGLNVASMRAAGLDRAYNPGFSNLNVNTLNITKPRTEDTISVTYPQNIIVNFTLEVLGEFPSTGVNFVNATIGGTLAPNTTIPVIINGNWSVNISIPEKSGVKNLTLWVRHDDTGNISATEPNSIIYDTCFYEGFGDWIVNLGDECTISTTIDLMNNVIKFVGGLTGFFQVESTGEIKNISRMEKNTTVPPIIIEPGGRIII